MRVWSLCSKMRGAAGFSASLSSQDGLQAFCSPLPGTPVPFWPLCSHPCLGATDAHCSDAPSCPQQRKAHVTPSFSILFEGPWCKQRAVRVWYICAILVQNISAPGSPCQGMFSKHLTEALMEALHSHPIQGASSLQSRGGSFFPAGSFTWVGNEFLEMGN